MNEQTERALRRRAIRLTLRGLRPTAILRTIPRSRAWLHKWQHRFYTTGWAGLARQSPRPQHSPQAYPPAVSTAVVRARQILAQRAVGLIGPMAIQTELRSWPDAPAIPAVSTIQRMLKAAGIIRPPAPPAAPPYYPQPTPTPQYPIQAMDWTERYLPGGAKVYAFHTIDLYSRALSQTISADKALTTVRRHLLQVWTHLGRPAGLQMDNDGAFCGGYKVPRVFGQVVRLCLYVGIEPIFIPFAEPRRNGVVERLNGLWSQGFWRRRHFTTLAEVAAASAEFEHWYMQEYQPPALQGRTAALAHAAAGARLSRAQVQRLPRHLPISAGRVHFLRQVDGAGEIRLLNERWRVGKRWAGRYVWATIITHKHQLRIYYRAAADAPILLLRQWPYRLAEAVVPLQAEFRWPQRRRKVSTMS